MQPRTFPKIPGLAVSPLGLGAMRLPTLPGPPPRLDEEASVQLIRGAIDAGVNYLDTAWPYHGGESEPLVGRALAGGWRQRVQLATKSPVWDVKTEGDWERILDLQLGRLATDHVDFYLLHALSGARWETVQRLGGLKALERARADGRLRHLGFSFHGALDDFKTIVDGHDWDFCQIQLNYLDQGFQAGLEGLRHAAERRVGVIVMEPLRGGALAATPPAVQQILARAGRPWSPAEWALRWVWSQPGVVTVLSGMGTPAQVAENVAAAAAAAPLTAAELALVEEVRGWYQARMAVPCTTCGYCQPCPHGVAIPDVFNAWNTARMFENPRQAAWIYQRFLLDSGSGADQCLACHECEADCPQQIQIAARLAEAHAALTAS